MSSNKTKRKRKLIKAVRTIIRPIVESGKLTESEAIFAVSGAFSAPTDELISPKEAARILGVSAKTLANWRVSGKHALPFYKLGASVKYMASEVMEFAIAAQRNSTSG